MSDTTPLQDLEAVCEVIAERWDKGMKSGKLLAALTGRVERYDPVVTRIRKALEPGVEPAPVDPWTLIDDDAQMRGSILMVAQYPGRLGWTDVYHGWYDAKANPKKPWSRWPHDFPPTHYQPVKYPA